MAIIMLPEQFFTKINQKIKAEWRFAFFSAFLLGFLVHLYRLTNPLLTWDSIYNFHDPQNTIHLGRCFLTLTCGISSYYDLPAVNGLLSLLYLSLTVVCITELFGLKKRLSIFLTAAVTLTFPTVASTLLYMYTADGYFLAMLLAALAVLLTLKYRLGFLPGLLLLCLSYGSYQAYISYAVMLSLIWALLQLLTTKISLKNFFRQMARFLLLGISGTLLYIVANKLLSVLEGIRASDYQGVSTMKIPGFTEILHAVPAAVTEFVYFFFGPLDVVNLFKILNLLLFALLFVLVICSFRKSGIFKAPARLILCLVCFGLLPFGCCLIYFVTPDVRYHMLMMMGFSLIYLLPVLLTDRLSDTASCTVLSSRASSMASERQTSEHAQTSKCFAAPLSWAVLALTLLTAYNFALIDNIAYIHAGHSYEKTYALAVEMMDRIEQTEGYEDASRLCVIGHFDNSDKISINFPPNMTGIKEGYLATEQNHFAAFFETYLSLELEGCSEEEQKAIGASSVVQGMGSWPAKDSVRIKNDIVIIKIGEDN